MSTTAVYYRFSTIKIEKDLITDVYTCNHEEADTRLLVHALEEETDIVVVSKDTDVFVLLVYAYCKMESTKKWYMKIDHRFVCIGTIVNYFGNSICSRLPHIHAITGCDTTSFFHGVGKVKVLKKMMNAEKDLAPLLDGLGDSLDVSDDVRNNVSKFVQVGCYSGLSNESYIQTRVRLYKKMKVKSSLSIPPDPHYNNTLRGQIFNFMNG